MEDAKLPPPNPERNAKIWNTHNGVFRSCRKMPAPKDGIMSNAVVKKMVFLPPARRIKNELGIRNVAPVNPAIAVSVNNSLGVKSNPKFFIWTVMIPHISHTEKPTSRLGIDIQRFRVAITFPVESQNSSFSTSHFFKSVILFSHSVF